MTKVKICGITNLEDALLSIKFGADALGFNFYEKSPRYLLPKKARGIINKLPSRIVKVGVFANEEPYTVGEVVNFVGLDAVQLHGDEDLEFVNELKCETNAKIIKAFRISTSFRTETISQFDLDSVLLDAYSADIYGGTGERFDWERARAITGVVPDLYLAGGLTPENVADAIREVRPYAVDVASGVETSPGKKDPKKLEAFIRNAKNA